jgi:hypothetical protein
LPLKAKIGKWMESSTVLEKAIEFSAAKAAAKSK